MLLKIQNLDKSMGPQTLFENLNIVVNEYDRIGLIGENGTGKSTLLKILASEENPDGGSIEFHKNCRFAYLPQMPLFADDDTAYSYVLRSLGEHRKALEDYALTGSRIELCSDPRELKKLLEEQDALHRLIDKLDAWTLDKSIEAMLSRWQIDSPHATIASMSGGQRRRVAIAALLLQNADILLVDEPTNHLDTDQIEFLQSTLANCRKTVIFVTHDRTFLDGVATRIIELHRSELLDFEGNYGSFLEQKSALLELRQKAQEKAAQLLVRELEWLRRGAKARTTKAKARIDRIAELEKQAKVIRQRSLEIEFNADPAAGNIVLRAEKLSKSFDSRLIFRNLDLSLQKSDKVAVVGPNGCGKTTLLKVLTGKIPPDSGQLHFGRQIKISYLSQQREGLDPKLSIYDALSDGDFVTVNGNTVHKKTLLQQMLFPVLLQDKLVSTLSGGEKLRLLFARMLCENGNVLVLDEPTNDMDIPSLSALEDALASFKGCVLFVTHDRFFINRLADAVLAFDPVNQTFVRYEGDYDFYLECKQKNEKTEKKLENKIEPKNERKVEKVRKLTFKEAKELEGMEDRITEAEEKKSSLESELSSPEIYKNNPERIPHIRQEIETLESQIADLYERWELLTEIAENGK